MQTFPRRQLRAPKVTLKLRAGDARHPPSPDSVINMKNVEQCVWTDKAPPDQRLRLICSRAPTLGPVSVEQRWLDLTLTWPDPPRASATSACISSRINALLNQLIETSDNSIPVPLELEIIPPPRHF